jgi:hypothetical protein
MQIIMFVLDDPNKLDDILKAWENVGISGVTIIESTGIQRRRSQQIDIPARFRFAAFTPLTVGGEEGNYTLLTIVDNIEKVELCIRATEKTIGSLDEPNSGILASWPLSTVRGLPISITDEDNA